MSATAPAHLLAAIPDDLLTHRHDDAKGDRVRAAALAKACADLGMRPSFADLYAERLRRGIARVAWSDLQRHYIEQDAHARARRQARRFKGGR